MDWWIFESAIATPYSKEENIRRGRVSMQHVIETHGKEPRAMYRQDIGWIGFEWGKPGIAPPAFSNVLEAAEWWSNLPGKTNKRKGGNVFKGGHGVSHIIAKRDWEAKWIDIFRGQSGVKFAYKCIDIIANGTKSETIYPPKKGIEWKGNLIILAPDSTWVASRELWANGKKREDYWLLSGFEVVDDSFYGIFESAGVTIGGIVPSCPTHSMPPIPCHGVGAADSMSENIVPIYENYKLRLRREPEYGTAEYGLTLKI